MNVLVIDKEDQLVKDIEFCLRVRYPDVAIIATDEARPALDSLAADLPDIVFVGSPLPHMPTIDLVKKIRELSEAAIIVISEGQNELRLAELLEAGADEFVTKQFSPIEFLAKVKSLLRRSQGNTFRPQRMLSLGQRLSIDFDSREVICSGKTLHLTPKEFDLLSELARNEGSILTHQMLSERLWGTEYPVDPSFLKKYVYRLRSKIEDDSNDPQMILNEWGVGYRFVS